MKMYQGNEVRLREELTIWRLIGLVTGGVLGMVLVYALMLSLTIIGG